MKRTFCSFLLTLSTLLFLNGLHGQTINFTGEELIGKPTDHSIAINIVPASTIEVYYQYGTSPGVYSSLTSTGTATANAPYEITIEGLAANTRYYYRMQYRTSGGSWVVRNEHSFMTQRAPGNGFIFTVTSDAHATLNSTLQNSMQHVKNDNPDLHIDLGDTFYPASGTNSQSLVNTAYLAFRPTAYFGAIGPSTPIFLASGNHEEEEGWNLDDTPFSIGVASIQSRKAYYPTPVPDGFYTGNSDPLAAIDEVTYGDELREDYYAWEWGDALFVVIDQFQYTPALPYSPTAGEGGDDSPTGDQWSWTLGAQQYTWLKETLENSTARFKFVFSHHMLGGIPRAISVNPAGYVRGGAEAAGYFEWGGKNADGTEGFAAHRDIGIFTKPIHQLFVENGVSAYFHGHDHQYVYETRDGVVYQEVPSPSMSGSGFGGIYTEGSNEAYQTIEMLGNAGHLRIAVTPTMATVDYVSSNTSSTVNYSYQIAPSTPVVTHELSLIVDPAGSGTTTPAAGTHTYAEDTEVAITANPATGFAFDHWTGDVDNTATPATTVTMDENQEVTAVFVAAPVYNLTMAVDPPAGGSVSPATGTHQYNQGSIVTLTATAASGYIFDHWASEVADAYETTTTVTMSGDQMVTAVFAEYVPTVVTLDGAVSSNSASSGTTLSFAHTTGSGMNRLMLVGVSWNCGSNDRTISSVTFTPSGGSAVALTNVITQKAGTQLRYSAIYSLLNPSSGVAGTVNITFSGSVASGIVAGAANFASVNQTTPLGTAGGAGSTSQGTAPTVTLNGLAGNELIFDNLFMGASASSQTLTLGSGQTQLWNAFNGSVRAASSTEQASSNSVTMSWTASSSAYWAIAAVPINLAASTTTYTLTATSGSNGSISPSGSITVAEGDSRTFTITPGNGYGIDDVLVDGASAGAVSSYTFTNVHADHTIAASFEALPQYTITATAGENGMIAPSGTVSVAQGNDQVFTIIPLSGYRIAEVLVDGSSAGTVSSYTFNDVAANHTIQASFEEIPAGTIAYVGEVGTAFANASGTSLEIPIGSAGVAVGNTIIVGFSSRGASTYNEPVVTDDAGNTYQLDTFAITYQHGRSYIFHAYVRNALSSGQHIIITTTSVGSRVAVASAFSGIAETNPLDQAKGNPTGTSTTNQGNNPSVGPSGTTTQANELLIGVIGTEDASTSADAGVGTWGNDFIAGPTIKSSGTDYLWRVSLGYRIVTSTGQYTASKIVANNPYWAASLATYKTTNTISSSSYNILLGRPTNNSITVNAILDESGDIYFEYGTVSGVYTSGQTAILNATAGEPVETVISGLAANTQYFYRLLFRPAGMTSWAAGNEYSFRTNRAKNETFSFTLTSDSHLGQTFSGNSPARYNQTTLNVANDHPDFHMDLGDAFIVEGAENQTDVNEVYNNQRPYFGNFSHSSPVFLAMGNHENEEGWNLDDEPFSTGIGSIIARKKYFLNPVTNGFYSGNIDPLSAVGGDQLREDYYSWEWGDALFIVLDPFQYTMTLPYSNVTGSGEEDDDDEPVSGDQWNWTLGLQQYNWLKQTLESSTAKYKFVFSHHVTGGQLTISNSGAGPATYVRGGAMAANYFEWGGQNANGSDGFETKRSSFPGDPIHQMMVANGVTAYFHGHDHQFVHEEIDGIAYQLVPSPGMSGYGFDLYDSSPYALSGGNLPDPGHLRVTVSPEETSVAYIQMVEGGGTGNGQVAYSYSIDAPIPESSITVTSPNGGENWIVGSGHNINWSSTGTVGDVRIECSTDNGSSWVVVTPTTANDGAYTWTVSNSPSSLCLIRVSETDGNPADVSNSAFTISPVTFILSVANVGNGTVALSPSGGTYNANSTVTLTPIPNAGFVFDSWSGADAGDVVETGGVYSIVMDGNKSITANFTQIPAIAITAPNGGQNWLAGSTHNITWTSVNISGTVLLEYSTDNGSNWTNIETSATNNGSYAWTIPNTLSVNCLVRISDTDGSPADASDAVFSIVSSLAQHFVPVWSNNGFDHMNFYTVTAKIDDVDLQPGDEIGIFDGTACVGVGILSQVLNGNDIFLPIKVSRDDEDSPEIEGYIPGHAASFRIWDASEEKELSSVEITYETDQFGEPYDNIFAVNGTSWYHISGVSAVEQVINLLSGWNIFSLYVTPDNTNMQAIVQPLIDAGKLIKVQSQAGDAIERDLSNNWQNRIGAWSNKEGYKIKVNASTSLSVTGMLITNPVNIALKSGWNIIGYPVSASYDAMAVLNPLITSGHLIKVQDEAGDAIERDLGNNWQNRIGTFDPDEGYKVRLSAADALSIDPSVYGSGSSLKSTKTSTLYATKLGSASAIHFKPIWNGNGLDHMNIYLCETSGSDCGLEPGDEFGIFDGTNCVGSGVIRNTAETIQSFVVSVDDPTTAEIDGFVEGNTMNFKIWRPATNTEAEITDPEFLAESSSLFEPMGTSMIRINLAATGLNAGVERTTVLGDNYPNPFTGKTTIPFIIGGEADVDLAVFDLLGNKVNTLVHATLSQGSHSVEWNTENNNGSKVNPGVYYIRLTAGDKVFVKTIVLIEN